jgi:hypothetical protein
METATRKGNEKRPGDQHEEKAVEHVVQEKGRRGRTNEFDVSRLTQTGLAQQLGVLFSIKMG